MQSLCEDSSEKFDNTNINSDSFENCEYPDDEVTNINFVLNCSHFSILTLLEAEYEFLY